MGEIPGVELRTPPRTQLIDLGVLAKKVRAVEIAAAIEENLTFPCEPVNEVTAKLIDSNGIAVQLSFRSRCRLMIGGKTG